MSEVFLTSPKVGDEDRELFERKFSEGDLVMTSQMRVDTTLRKVRNLVASGDKSVDLNELETLVEQHLATTIKSTSYETADNVMDYFHLKIKHALIHQIVHAYPLFERRDKFPERRELVDGVYGAVATILEEALSLYDDAKKDEHGYLTGAINELTVLALLNRRQVPERLAIPADTTSDLFNATDLEYFRFKKGRSAGSSYHVQVKTRQQSSNKVQMPADGILVHAKHISNQHRQSVSFPTSRAIVAEVNAQDSDAQTQHLTRAVEKFEAHMDRGIEESEEFRDIMRSMPPEMLETIMRAMKSVRNVINDALADHPDATEIVFDMPKDE